MNWKQALTDWFADHEQEGIRLCADLVRQNTVNPPGNEYLAARVVAEWLEKYDIPSTVFESAPGRANLIASVGSGSPRLFVPAHTDVVPAGDGWEQDPFELVVKDGYMYGRGVNDDKGPLVSLLLLAAFLARHAGEYAGTLIVGAVADEEMGSRYGLTYMLEKGLVAADYAIVPDTGASINQLSCGEKGLLHLEITFFGRQAHGSTPEEGLNAVWAAHTFLNRVKELFGPEHGYCLEPAHELFSPTTINVARISAGSAINIVPGECTLGLDIRYVPPQTGPAVIKLLNDMAAGVQNESLCERYTVATLSHMEPFEIQADNPVVQAIRAAVQELTGTDSERMGMSGTTVCKQLIEHDIPAIGFSQDAERTAHKAGERLAVAELGRFGTALGLAFLKLGGNW